MPIAEFSEVTKKALGNYVYCLCSVINGEKKIFYIGEGVGNRVFDHEKNNYSDLTDKGIEISKILSTGGSIEKYILDCQMEDSKTVTGQSIAFHAENALINLAKLAGIEIFNTQVGHGILKRATLVDEVEAMFLTESINMNIFDNKDKVMIYVMKYNSQDLFHSPHRKELVTEYIKRMTIRTTEERAIPQYLCVVYRSVFEMIFKLNAELLTIQPTRECGRVSHHLQINDITPTTKYVEYIGRSFGDVIKRHAKKGPQFTY